MGSLIRISHEETPYNDAYIYSDHSEFHIHNDFLQQNSATTKKYALHCIFVFGDMIAYACILD